MHALSLRLSWCLAILALVCGLVSQKAQAAVSITEFMAANVRTLADRDRDFPDWIELHNADAQAASLEGWSLTDDRANLQKWKFPPVNLGPSEFLLVFASGKDRRAAGAELHTSFKLDPDSGYLALVKPDGKTVASEFKYPRQVAGASYGMEMAARPAVALSAGAPRRVHVPRDGTLGSRWTATEFDDGTWRDAAGGAVAFSAGATNDASGTGWLRGEMLNKSASAYVRVPFELKESAFESLRLRVRADDGFVAYLNGREVARSNAPAKAAWDSVAPLARAAGGTATLLERFDGKTANFVTSQLEPNTAPRVTPGTNGGGILRLLNGRFDNQVASVAFPQVAPGLFDGVTADFDFRWRADSGSTERLAFLLIPVAQYGASGPGVDMATLREQKDARFPGVLSVQLLFDPAEGKKALTVFWDRNRVTTVDLPPNLFGPRVFHHARVRLAQTGQGMVLGVELVSDAHGPTRAAHAAIGAMAVPGIVPFQSRLQFVARAGSIDQTADIAAVKVDFQKGGAVRADEFDLTPFLSALRPGRNVLAIHGLNHAAADGSFVLEPELVAMPSSARRKEPQYFPVPTPRSVNSNGLAALAPPPVFSRRGGVFSAPVSVELSAASGTVRYTLDGSEPNATSEPYSQPVTLTATTLVRAKTFVLGSLPSATVTETFTITDETGATFESNLPLLILNPFGRYISQGGRTPVSLQIVEPGKGGKTTPSGRLDFDGRATANVRGFSTLRQPKNSLTIRLVDENNSKVKASLLGMPKESDWVLYAPYADKTMMRDVLAYELSNAMGRYAPRTRFVEVFIDRSGGKLGRRDYMGVFVLVEKIKRDKNRVDIAEFTPSDAGVRTGEGSFIIKRDHSDRYEPNFRSGQQNSFFYVYPDPDEMSREQMNGITTYMRRLDQSIYGEDFKSPTKGYAAFLDVDAFIDQHWLIEMSKNIDGFRYSAFLHKDRGGKVVAGPAWDWNLSFGNADYYDASDPTGWYTDMLRESEISWFRRLREDPDFAQRAVDRWAELRRTAFATSRIHKRVDELAASLHDAQSRNFTRWPIMGRRVSPNEFVGDTYEEEVKWMKQWIQKRLDWIDRQSLAAPAIVQEAGKVTLRSAGGKIYYTLDGSDPRAPGGGVSPKAEAYTSPLPLTSAGRIVTRAQGRGGWSAPERAQGKAK